jgi:endonuclease/exonuclease/phosphatase (EEP) superfamily protein YafD
MKPVVKDFIGAMAQGIGGTVLVIGIASMFLARQLWLADLLVNFQVHFIACLLVCLFLLVLVRRQLTAAVLLLGTLVLALPVIPYLKVPFRGEPTVEVKDEEKVYRLMTYNVLQSNTRSQDIADYISTESVDFLVIIEADAFWEKELEFELKDHFPHRFTKPREDKLGLLFYSKHPWESIRLVSEFGFPTVEATFALPEGNMRLLGVHSYPPLTAGLARDRNAFLAEFGEYAAGLSGSVLGVGDFNLTPWSPHFQDLLSRGDLRDSSLGRGIQNTWYKFPTLLCGLPIDHVLTREIAVRHRHIGPPIGSDHRAITVDFLLRSANQSPHQ